MSWKRENFFSLLFVLFIVNKCRFVLLPFKLTIYAWVLILCIRIAVLFSAAVTALASSIRLHNFYLHFIFLVVFRLRHEVAQTTSSIQMWFGDVLFVNIVWITSRINKTWFSRRLEPIHNSSFDFIKKKIDLNVFPHLKKKWFYFKSISIRLAFAH